MRNTEYKTGLVYFAALLFLTLISGSLTMLLTQWNVREFHTLSGKITTSEEVVVGNLDGSPTSEIVWIVGGKKGDYRVLILNGVDGEVKWRSDPYFKIFSPTVKIADIDGDNRNELIFTAIATEQDAISMYVVSYQEGRFVETQRPRVSPEATTNGVTTPKTIQSPAPSQSDKKPPASTDVKMEVPPTLLPDNFSAVIPYSVSEKALVQIAIFGGTGEVVRTLLREDIQPGEYSKTWDGKDDEGKKLSVGTYFYKVTVGTNTFARKPIISR